MAKELSKTVASLSERLGEHIAINAETGAGHVPETIYETMLPEHLSLKVVQDVRTHDANFVAAATHAYGMKAVDVLAQNRDSYNQSSIDIGMGHKDSLHVNVTGEIAGVDGKPSTFGHTTAILTTHAGEVGTQLKTALHMIAEAADRAYAQAEEVTGE